MQRTLIYISELIYGDELSNILSELCCGIELIRFSIADNLDLLPRSYDSRIRKVTFERFAQAYEAAQILGADCIIFHSGMIPSIYMLEG